MQVVGSGKYCEKHKMEKTYWQINERYTAGGYFACNMCRKESSRRSVAYKESNWRRRGMVGLTWERWQTEATHCRICGTTERLVADHDHATKQFRGVLCRDCNLLLGNAKDDQRRLRCAELYLGGQPCW